MALIDVEIEDHLGEVSTSRLVAEIRSRRREPQSLNRVFYDIPARARESRVQRVRSAYERFLSEKQGARPTQ